MSRKLLTEQLLYHLPHSSLYFQEVKFQLSKIKMDLESSQKVNYGKLNNLMLFHKLLLVIEMMHRQQAYKPELIDLLVI